MSITLQDISFRYPKRLAINEVSLTANSGSFTGLLGPNGAGKSTLFALMTRLYRLQQGDIVINDLSINQHPHRVMSQLGVVFQQSTLDLDLTVLQNLNYHASLHGLSPKAARPSIERELARIDMLERVDDKVRTLNGGHRRRLEIARALVHQPSVLLLDEATVGLDPQTRKDINNHVRTLCLEQNLTVLWSTHLIDEIHEQDPVFVLHKGEIKAQGTSQAVCESTGTSSLQEAFTTLTRKDKPS